MKPQFDVQALKKCKFSEHLLRFLFGGAGFSRVLIKQGRSGFLVRADR